MDDPRLLAFLDGPLKLGDITLRPLSIQTILLSEFFGLTVVLSGGEVNGLTQAALDGQLSVFVWMQSADIVEVLQSARDDSWRKFLDVRFSEDNTLAAVLILELRRHRDTLAAARFRISGGSSESGIFHPSWYARNVHLMSYQRGWSEEFCLWHLPYTRALQYDHCVVRSLGWKTVHESEVGTSAPGAVQLAKLDAASNQEAVDEGW